MRIIGEIVSYDGEYLTIKAKYPEENVWMLEKQKAKLVEIRIPDGREISAKQRKLIYAILRDIADWVGNHPDYEKALQKYNFIVETGCDMFSLSNVDMTTANRFIDYLLDECLKHGIILSFRPADLLNDKQIGKFLYRSLIHKKCCICGKPADMHHIDAVGAGRNRDEICHIGMRAMTLCRAHHNEAHSIGQRSFNDKHHVYGIKIDAYLNRKLDLGRSPEHGSNSTTQQSG